jgi:hypothetical protein
MMESKEVNKQLSNQVNKEKEYIMKTILRIIVILLVATLVAGGFYLGVNNTSTTASASGQFPTMTSADGQTQQLPSRPEGGPGGEEGGDSLGGLLGIFVTLAKLTGITLVVLLVEKGLSLLSKGTPKPVTG